MEIRKQITELIETFFTTSSFHPFPHFLRGGYVRRIIWIMLAFISISFLMMAIHFLIMDYQQSPKKITYHESKKQVTRGSQYRCGWVGRVIQALSTPSPTPYTLTNTDQFSCSIKNARFRTFKLGHHEPTDQRTDRPTD